MGKQSDLSIHREHPTFSTKAIGREREERGIGPYVKPLAKATLTQHELKKKRLKETKHITALLTAWETWPLEDRLDWMNEL